MIAWAFGSAKASGRDDQAGRLQEALARNALRLVEEPTGDGNWDDLCLGFLGFWDFMMIELCDYVSFFNYVIPEDL